MEAQPEHPFFVYGHGWSSCHPDGSLQVFGLKCNRLQVGDICISLTPREVPLPLSQQSVTTASVPLSHQYYNPYTYSKDDMSATPQNLSRKPQTIPTTATGTAVTSRPASHVDVSHSLAAYTTFLNCPSNASTSHSIQGIVMRSDDSLCHSSSSMVPSSSSTYLSRPLSQDGLTRTIPLHIIGSAGGTLGCSQSILTSSAGNRISTNFAGSLASLPPQLPPSSSTIYSCGISSGNGGLISGGGHTDDEMLIVDATLSNRKRRWSAPDNNICDDENCQQKASGQKNCNH